MSDFAVFVTLRIPASVDIAVDKKHIQPQLRFLQSLDSIATVELYLPETSALNAGEAVPAPAMIIQIDCDSRLQATELMQSASFKRYLLQADAYAFQIDSISLENTEKREFLLPDQKIPQPRVMPLSFVVRYYGPVENASDFIDFYTQNHAPILSEFEGVRNVLCYLPSGWQARKKITSEQLIIGNEVVFDNQQALLHALSTDVLLKARADSKLFQPFGYSTHHVMHRETLYSRHTGEPGNV